MHTSLGISKLTSKNGYGWQWERILKVFNLNKFSIVLNGSYRESKKFLKTSNFFETDEIQNFRNQENKIWKLTSTKGWQCSTVETNLQTCSTDQFLTSLASWEHGETRLHKDTVEDWSALLAFSLDFRRLLYEFRAKMNVEFLCLLENTRCTRTS